MLTGEAVMTDKDQGATVRLPSDPFATFDPMRSLFAAADSTPARAGEPDVVSLSPWFDTSQPPEFAEPASTSTGDRQPFVLSRFMARGGYGEVWEGEQSALGRSIAIKRIREDLLDAGDPRRARYLAAAFRQEAVTMARLDHPNILPVHDLGIDERGNPLIGMKLVRGTPWQSLIRSEAGSAPEAEFLARHIAILIAVGNAVAFAHSRGIVHRDVKPSQVMVGEFGETLLMDWGIAILYDASLLPSGDAACGQLPTPLNASSPAGTVAFMAPEQTETTAARVGPWTDVYLLGGTLYYLLTGLCPHEGETAERIYYNAANGMVRRPEERAPDREIPRALADLAMHALEADPARRIRSARDFVAALQDYSSGADRRREAQQLAEDARLALNAKPSTYEELAAILGNLAAAQAQWPGNARIEVLQSRTCRAYARLALDHGDLLLARVQTEKLPEGAERQALLAEIGALENEKREARRRLVRAHEKLARDHRRAEELMNFLLGDLRRRLEGIGRLDILDAVGERIEGYLASVDPEDLEDDARARRAEALRLIGEAKFGQGRTAESAAAFEEALAISRDLADRQPGDPLRRHALAMSMGAVGRQRRSRSDLTGALELYRQQYDILCDLSSAHPDRLDWRHDLAETHYNLADVLAVSGDLKGARAFNANYRALMQELTAIEPQNIPWRRSRAGAEADFGWLLKAEGDLDGALRQYRLACDMVKSLAGSDVANPAHRMDVAFFHNKIGAILELQGNGHDAIGEYRKAQSLTEALVDRDPSNAGWKRQLAIGLVRTAGALTGLGKTGEAKLDYGLALDILTTLTAESPADVWNRTWLSRAMMGMGGLALESGDGAAAEQWFREAAAGTSGIAKEFARTGVGELAPVATHALALHKMGKAPEARALALKLQAAGFTDPQIAAIASGD